MGLMLQPGQPQLYWTLDPLLLATAAVAALLFARAFLRLRRRGRADLAPWSRVALFACGLSALVLPLVTPLDPLADHYLLSAHMLEHVLIGDAAPALLLLALRGPLLFFFVAPDLFPALAHSQPLRRAGSFLLRPRVAVTAWAVVMAAWHVPAVYDYALGHQAVHDLEHACFFTVGLLVWWQLIDPAAQHRLSRGQRLGVAAALFWLGTVLTDVLVFSFRPLYPAYAHQPVRVFGLQPLLDQQLAGIVMMGEQLLSLGTFCTILLVPVVAARRRRTPAGVPREQTA